MLSFLENNLGFSAIELNSMNNLNVHTGNMAMVKYRYW